MKHENLWAPWRLGYITGERAKPDVSKLQFLSGADRECFLCRAAVDPDERATLTLQKTSLAMVVINRFPYNNGHLLVAPKRHVGRLDQMTTDEHRECNELLTSMTNLLERELKCEGFNIGLNLGRVSGAGVPGHLHWHIVPRWSGDTNFIPVMAGIRVIPQALDDLYDFLSGVLKKS